MNLFSRKSIILLVCRENICRSPMAEGLLRFHLRQSGLDDQYTVRSAGTQVSRSGSRSDQRAQRAARFAGIDISRNRAHRVSSRDLARSDMVLAMDATNRQDLLALCEPGQGEKIGMLLDFLPGHEGEDVPDPYYGSPEGFEVVFALLEQAMVHLVSALVEQTAP